jgi:hypothetical protein
MKTQHNFIVSETQKISGLNLTIVQTQQRKQQDHLLKMQYYKQTQHILEKTLVTK